MQTNPIQIDVEERLASAEPAVEVLSCERIGAERLQLFIDHPEGVDLALCERVTRHLRDLPHHHQPRGERTLLRQRLQPRDADVHLL